MDTLLCIVRRPLRAFLSYDGQPRPLGRALKLIFQPDKDHIHHRVLSLGVPHQWSVVLLYGVSVLLGFGALMLTYAGPTAVLITAVGAGVGTFTFVRQLNYRELALLRNGLFLRLYEFPILGSRGFQATVDTLIMIVAFTAARFMAGEIIAGAPFIFALALSVGVQMGIFLFTGIYRITIRTPGIGDALKIVRVNVAAGLILVAVMALAGGGNFDSLVLSCILNFFFMITATLAMRFSYRVLAFLATDMDPNKQRVLIYGAGPSGIAALNLLLSSQAASAVPMGFLDDDPLLEGKTLHGYPIYGGHWKVAGLIRKLGISEIMVADTNIRREILRRLRVATRLTKTSLHFVSVRLDNIPAGREGRPEPAPEQAQEQEAEFAKVAVTPQQ
jgi:UDP-GlcNAc:undecaprenyl-phosphate GlcNAc-1-phosphate transferase